MKCCVKGSSAAGTPVLGFLVVAWSWSSGMQRAPVSLHIILIDIQCLCNAVLCRGEVRDLQHRARYELGFSVTLADPWYPQLVSAREPR